MMPITCAGCSAGHLSSATVLMREYTKFWEMSNKDKARVHLNEAIGNLRQAEEQHPNTKFQERIRFMRKKIEMDVAAGQFHAFYGDEIQNLGADALKYLSEHPEECPTCEFAHDDGGHECEHCEVN